MGDKFKMVLHYSTGEELRIGDRVTFGGIPGRITEFFPPESRTATFLKFPQGGFGMVLDGSPIPPFALDEPEKDVDLKLVSRAPKHHGNDKQDLPRE